MDTSEIKLEDLVPETFVEEAVKGLSDAVGDGIAINALSGGVDSAAVTMLGHRALGDRLKTYFIEHGLMREGEPQRVAELFAEFGVTVELLDAREQFFGALAGLTDPEEKRNAITKTFYETVFGPLVVDSGARYLLHGTNYTDVEETLAGIKRQHNILAQLGIDPEEAYGYKVLEPLVQIRKRGVRRVARSLGLPEEICDRPPFPGPALATRIIGEVTFERVATVRAATSIVEQELLPLGAFQCLGILHEDRVTGIRDGEREFGQQIEVRCWDSDDAVTGTPTEVPFEILTRLGHRLTEEVPGVVSVTYNVAAKPPSTIEAI
jgi:GMP synthase (glutamine-hydrolysing)